MIYALNTKNDEHEEEIESLKEAHEDEVRAQEISSSHPYNCYVILYISHVGSTNQYSRGPFAFRFKAGFVFFLSYIFLTEKQES